MFLNKDIRSVVYFFLQQADLRKLCCVSKDFNKEVNPLTMMKIPKPTYIKHTGYISPLQMLPILDKITKHIVICMDYADIIILNDNTEQEKMEEMNDNYNCTVIERDGILYYYREDYDWHVIKNEKSIKYFERK
jgi:hypothetical protein